MSFFALSLTRRFWPLHAQYRLPGVFSRCFFDSPSAKLLLPTERHGAVLAEVISEAPHLRGSILHDVHTAVLMREHGIREICTRDTGFSRFAFLRVLDPLA